jgi:hypothetical protein
VEDTTLDDERSLVHNTFLVVPLLQTKGLYVERKFSGNDQTGHNNVDFAGKLVDAFAHHVLEHTNGEYMLADIQGSFFSTSRCAIVADFELQVLLAQIKKSHCLILRLTRKLCCYDLIESLIPVFPGKLKALGNGTVEFPKSTSSAKNISVTNTAHR